MCQESWVPTVPQIVMASERPILAVLDTTLELAARTLRAEHASLDENASRGSGAEPPPPCEALATSILVLARSLREVIGSYCTALEHIHGDREPPARDNFPF